MSNYTNPIGDNLTSLLEDVTHVIEIDKLGAATARIEFTCRWNVAINQIRAYGFGIHPDFGFLKKSKTEISRMEADWAKVAISYEGVADPTVGSGEEVTYTLEGSTTTEPIECHPNFINVAGTPENPKTKYGPTWDEEGRFAGFAAKTSTGTQNPKAGQQSFLSGSLTYSEEKVIYTGSSSFVNVSAGKLGSIDTPPNSKVRPNLRAKSNWLLIGFSANLIGDSGIRVSRSWKASGPNGWDVHWYDDKALDGAYTAGT